MEVDLELEIFEFLLAMSHLSILLLDVSFIRCVELRLKHVGLRLSIPVMIVGHQIIKIIRLIKINLNLLAGWGLGWGGRVS